MGEYEDKWYILTETESYLLRTTGTQKRCRTRQAGVAEWSTAPCLLCAAWMVVGSILKPPPMLTDTSAGTWVEKTWLPC